MLYILQRFRILNNLPKFSRWQKPRLKTNFRCHERNWTDKWERFSKAVLSWPVFQGDPNQRMYREHIEMQIWSQYLLVTICPHCTLGGMVDVQQSKPWGRDDMKVHSAELNGKAHQVLGKAHQVLVPLTLAYGNYMS